MQGQVQFNAKLIENSCSLLQPISENEYKRFFWDTACEYYPKFFSGHGLQERCSVTAVPTEFEREEMGWDGMALCHWGCAGEQYLFQKEDGCTVMNLTFSLLEAINTEPKYISLLHDFLISTAKINSLYIQNNPWIPSPIIL